MRVTVCELPHGDDLDAAWGALASHCRSERSDLVVLPEMAFSDWLAADKEVDPDRWAEAVHLHDTRLERLGDLGVSIVVGSRPIIDGDDRYNEAFVWEDGAYRASHRKALLPDEDLFWEATWYERGIPPRGPVDTATGGVGILVCTEIWFTEHARALGRTGITVLANPRATEHSTRDKWLIGGQAAAIMSGAYCLSSNHSGHDGAVHWGGLGWIIDPDGTVLATTDTDRPFATVDVDPLTAERAKATYPRYVE